MAGTAVSDFGNFRKAVEDHVTLHIDRIMAPIKQVHMFVNLSGTGADHATFPYSDVNMSMGSVTDGTVYNTQTAAPIKGKDVTPTGYEAQILIPEFAVRNNPANYVQYASEQFAGAAHDTVMGLLSTAYQTLTASGGVAGASLTRTMFLGAAKALRKVGTNGQLYGVLHPESTYDLIENVSNVGDYGRVGAEAMEGQLTNLYGVMVSTDSGVDLSGTYGYGNFVGTKDCIGVAFGFDPQLKILEAGDATHIKLAMAARVAVGVVSVNRGSLVWGI